MPSNFQQQKEKTQSQITMCSFHPKQEQCETADRQQLGSSPGFTFQEVGVCVVPMNQEETRSLEIFDIVYSSGLLSLGVPGVPGLNI